MADSEGGGSNIFETIFSSFFELIGAAIPVVFGALWKLVRFVIWVLLAIIILPCVFVAGEIYPKWAEWGEDF